MSINLINHSSLQDKRIAEIEKEVKNNKYAYEYYVDEYYSLINVKEQNKQQYKGENNDQTIYRK